MTEKTSKKMKEIIERIRYKRESLGYSYQDLAVKTGMSKSTLQRYESGFIKNMPLDKLEPLAEALLCTPEYIMGWDNEEHIREILAPNQKLILSDLDTLNASGQTEAIKQVHNLTYIPEYSTEDSEDTIIIQFNPQMKEEASNGPVLMAAHNDQAEDPGEAEKMRRDAKKIAELKKKK